MISYMNPLIESLGTMDNECVLKKDNSCEGM